MMGRISRILLGKMARFDAVDPANLPILSEINRGPQSDMMGRISRILLGKMARFDPVDPANPF
jgi:hypothetical protein